MITKGTLDYLEDDFLAEIDVSQEEHGIIHDAHVLKLYKLLDETDHGLEYDGIYKEVEYGQPWQMNWTASPPEFMPDPYTVDLVGEMDVVMLDESGKNLYYFEVKKESEKCESKAEKQLKTAKKTVEEYEVYGSYFFNDLIESMDEDWIKWYLEPGFVEEVDLAIPIE